MQLYPVAEKFVSINGEGVRAGELAAFIRFRGCNLRCSYCDTKWAISVKGPAKMMTTAQLCSFAFGITNVTLTGGEPLIHDLDELIIMLCLKGHRVEIETNGSIALDHIAALDCRQNVTFTMDYKLPSCSMETMMRTENFGLLGKNDTVKFVAGSFDDLVRAKQIIGEYDLTSRCHVYLSPVFGAIDPADIVDFMKAEGLNDVRLQLQLHKYIWDPDKRGV